MYSRTTWDDYFTGSPTLIQKNDYTSRQTPSGTNIYVLNCLFRSITSSSSGGALSCSSVTYFLVESTSFFSCKASSYGGAIHFTNTNSGQCVLHEVCGNDCCSSSSGGHFIWTDVNNAASSKNYINYSSFAHCVNENSNSWYTLCLCSGKIFCPSINISMNKCYSRSGIYSQPYNDRNYVISSLTYSTFADNNAIQSTCIRFCSGGAKFEIKFCNILRNTQGSLSSEGTILSDGVLTIEDSCILENTATYIFSQDSSSYTITLSNCTVDSTSNNGYLTTKNTVTKSFILALNHMSTQNCHAKYDVVGVLTPNAQTPSPSKKQIYCFTGERLFYIPQNEKFFSLTSVLVFNFVCIKSVRIY
jgi:hypothetical protein